RSRGAPPAVRQFPIFILSFPDGRFGPGLRPGDQSGRFRIQKPFTRDMIHSDETWRRARKLYETTDLSQVAIADLVGVSRGALQERIRRGEWVREAARGARARPRAVIRRAAKEASTEKRGAGAPTSAEAGT